jgi:hypothetical protein
MGSPLTNSLEGSNNFFKMTDILWRVVKCPDPLPESNENPDGCQRALDNLSRHVLMDASLTYQGETVWNACEEPESCLKSN